MKAKERKEKILQAASKTFARLGFQKASIEDVCKEAGIARGTLYQYFYDKQGLFREVLHDYSRRIEEFMKPFTELGIELPADREGVKRLMAMRMSMIFETIAKDRDIYEILFREAISRTTETDDLVREINNKFLALMLTEMKAAAEKGVVRMEDMEFNADFIMGGIFKIAHEHIFEKAGPVDISRLSEKTAEIIIRIILK